MALLDNDRGYQAILTHDPRFDGVFFVGVTTTRIYCRNVCRAKTPQRKNCTFYPSAAAAEQAGFRPCLLCRPELAPGNARIDAAGRLAAAVAKRMEEGSFIEQRFGDLAQEFGVSDRPIDLADATLVLAAEKAGYKQILTLDSGFLFYQINNQKSFDIVQA
jgi:AraC family transcriptional regulator, regulatory protein of adaptative response / DNA-3-methyladenine glycosylase II